MVCENVKIEKHYRNVGTLLYTQYKTMTTSTESIISAYEASLPYALSEFQRRAIEGLITGHHVLVTAHTGSGKTLPALFAIQHFTGRRQQENDCGGGGSSRRNRVIYTSPIKALSNQKFWEFSEKFPDISVGLSTGDIKANEDADVVVMTTEILMNKLFAQPETLDRVACVVFDEVHYINDESRGHVWEQTILMLPRHISMLMLSATIDRPERLAAWIDARPPLLKDEEMNQNNYSVCVSDAESKEEDRSPRGNTWVCSTAQRAVPLSHYMFITVGENIYKLFKDDSLKQEIRRSTKTWLPLLPAGTKAQFHDASYHQAKKMLDLFQNKNQHLKRKFVVNDLLKSLVEKEALPAIFFVFSRKQVEQVANEITATVLPDDSKVPYTMATECEHILRTRLSNYAEYLALPEYQALVRLLEKGVAFHHSGMIPVLREIVEWFIAKKKVYVLIATESFSIGLDCPIKTAVFLNLQKHDGREWRYLKPHEYTQMAGRAGRRGIDTVGHVIHCNNLFAPPTMTEYRQIVQGSPQTLVSKFKIQYSVILALLSQSDQKDQKDQSDQSDQKDQDSNQINSNENTIVISLPPTDLQVPITRFIEFARQSMAYKEQSDCLTGLNTQFSDISRKIVEKRESLRLLPTPTDEINRFRALEAGLFMASPKKLKETVREMKSMREMYKDLDRDVAQINALAVLEKERTAIDNEIRRVEDYGLDEISAILRILEGLGFVTILGNRNLGPPTRLSLAATVQFTRPLGHMCSVFGEIHPLLIPHFHTAWRGLHAKQWIAILSCFGSAKCASEEERRRRPASRDPVVQAHIESLIAFCYTLEDLEQDRLHYVLTQTEDLFTFDLIDDVMDWCDAQDVAQCRAIIQGIEARGFSLGDFAKMLLKIVATAREVEAMAQKVEDVELQHTMVQIPELLLKYVVTAQTIWGRGSP
jgi:superfamily II RNA helicase